MNNFDKTFLAQLGSFENTNKDYLVTPIVTSTAYSYLPSDENLNYIYTRTKNPTRDVLEKAIAKLERGIEGFATSSGMAAIVIAIEGILNSGDKIVSVIDVYGGSYTYFQHLINTKKYVVDLRLGENDLLNAIDKDTKLVFLETPTNPMMTTYNIKKISEKAHKFGAIVVIDNTLLTPIWLKPLEEGADISLHSATKFISGHHDVLAGLASTNNLELATKMRNFLNMTGAILSPFDCWLTLRGMKTLYVRMKQHQINTEKVVEFLKSEPMVEKVYYCGKSGILSFKIIDETLSITFAESLQNIVYAVSLGGTETSISIPYQETHRPIPEEIKEKYDLDKKLFRLAVGIEDVEDIISDLKQAFEKIRT